MNGHNFQLIIEFVMTDTLTRCLLKDYSHINDSQCRFQLTIASVYADDFSKNHSSPDEKFRCHALRAAVSHNIWHRRCQRSYQDREKRAGNVQEEDHPVC